MPRRILPSLLPFSYSSYSVEYIEDGDPIFPFDIPEFSISDDDNFFLLIATVTIENADEITTTNYTDQLYIPAIDPANLFQFSIDGNGTSRIEITATGALRLFTPRDEFVILLRNVSFVTDDQAPYIVRNLSLIVEEYPLGETGPSLPGLINITVTPINDRPSLVSSQVSQASLDDYLPQDVNNPSFNTSFLLLEKDVEDVDRNVPNPTDFIGLAIVATDDGGIGTWQYWYNGSWVAIECSPLLLSPEVRVRFSPAPSVNKLDGDVSITYRAWDGSSNVACDNGDLSFTEGT